MFALQTRALGSAKDSSSHEMTTYLKGREDLIILTNCSRSQLQPTLCVLSDQKLMSEIDLLAEMPPLLLTLKMPEFLCERNKKGKRIMFYIYSDFLAENGFK